MFFQTLKVLWPSFAMSLVLLVGASLAFWFVWTKLQPARTFKWQIAVFAAFGLFFYQTQNTLVSVHMNQALVKNQNGSQEQSLGSQATQPNPNLSPKDALLQDIDRIVREAKPVTAEMKKQFFNSHKEVFKDKASQTLALTSVLSLFECQRFFWEDALASFQTKKSIKSDSRKTCENLSGEFFEREKIFTSEVIKKNEESMAQFASHKRIPAADGKEVEVTETVLRSTLDAQIRTLDYVRTLLSQ